MYLKTRNNLVGSWRWRKETGIGTLLRSTSLRKTWLKACGPLEGEDKGQRRSSERKHREEPKVDFVIRPKANCDTQILFLRR